MLPSGVRIAQHYGEHPPPHFHAFQGEDEALISITDLSVYAGRLKPAALRSVRAWARRHRPELMDNWHAALAQAPLRPMSYP